MVQEYTLQRLWSSHRQGNHFHRQKVQNQITDRTPHTTLWQCNHSFITKKFTLNVHPAPKPTQKKRKEKKEKRIGMWSKNYEFCLILENKIILEMKGKKNMHTKTAVKMVYSSPDSEAKSITHTERQ